MNCPHCGTQLKVVATRGSSEEGCKHKAYVRCPKCKLQSSTYHVDNLEDLELVQTAAQRELFTEYQIEFDNSEDAPLPKLSTEAVTNLLEEIRRKACNEFTCSKCIFSSDKSSVVQGFGMVCDESFESRHKRVKEKIRENLPHIM